MTRTRLLFGLEEEFSVLAVERIDPTTVKMIIEQTGSSDLSMGDGWTATGVLIKA